MVRLTSLKLAVAYIQKIHTSGMNSAKGLNIYSSFRQPDGSKIIFSIIHGAKITSFDNVEEDSLIIHQTMRGIAPKGYSSNASVSHSLFLSGLRIINVYEVFTEFLTVNRIDHMYVLPKGPSFTMLAALEMLPPPPIIAQWCFGDEKLEDSIDNLGKTVIKRKKEPKLELDLS